MALALFVCALQACRSESAKLDLNSQNQPAAQPGAQASPQPSPKQEVVPAPANFKETFVGAIDGKHDIQMALERNGDKLTGSYFYVKPGASNVAMKTLDLKGGIDDQGRATLIETSQNYETGKELKTGEFKGKLEGVSADGGLWLRFSGVWMGAKDKRQWPFNLRELQFDLGGLKFDEQQQQDANQRLRYEIETKLPQLVGGDAARAEKFNSAVNAFVARRNGEFKKAVGEMARESAAAKSTGETAPPSQQNSLDVSYEVTAANQDFVSILFYFFEYTGGAHPNTTTSSFNYDLRRNAPINLSDLFLPNSNHLRVISNYAARELKKVGTASDIESGAAPKPENYKSWNITPAGLRFTFDRYQVGPYAAGEHEVIVPYSALKPIIKPDGLIARFVK